jgi:hypothetical protein
MDKDYVHNGQNEQGESRMSDFNWSRFNADEVDTSITFPAGWYPVIFVESETKKTNKGGEMLTFEGEILEGKYKGRKYWEQLNLVNASKQAEEISHRTLASICKAVGIIHPRGSEELHMKPIMAKIAIQPENDNFPPKNVAKAYAPISDKSKLMGAPDIAPMQATHGPAPIYTAPAPINEPDPIPVTLGAPTDGKKPWEA